ncbi:MAG: ABC transporter permease subunit [Myxococcales bacterium]|nr:ABC transporter permease subunit [Myxococcales bacterium]
MNAILTIARREIYSWFVSPIAYVVLTVWLLTCGMVFFLLAMAFSTGGSGGGENLLQAFFGGTSFFYQTLLVFAPILTMRLLAEERARGTMEALLTAPVTEVQVVLGKYLAAMVFWVSLWVPTLLYVWVASGTAEDVIDYGALAATYVGLLGLGVFFMAIGLLMSAVARNQIVAAMLTFMVLGGIYVLGFAGYIVPDDDLRAIFEYLGMWAQMSTFSKGLIDTRYLVFDGTVALLSLFLAVRVLQANRAQ